MREFQIECGKHRGLVKAATLGSAWRKLTRDKKSGFAPLARFIETKGRVGIWQYVTPQTLDQMK